MFSITRDMVIFLLFAYFYFIGYIFTFRHDIFRRIEKKYKEIVPPVRYKPLVHSRLFMVNGIISTLIAFVLLHLFLVDASNGRCGIFINIPATCTIIICAITGTVSIFNPEKLLRLYTYMGAWISKYMMKVPSPLSLPEEVYKRRMLNIRITGAAWLMVALAGACILH